MIDITLYGTAPTKLKTNGKYCDQDITIRNNYEVIDIIPTKREQVEMPKLGYSGIGRVTIKPIPDEYIIPEGSIDIVENGEIDVSQFQSAFVNVAGSGGNLEKYHLTIYEDELGQTVLAIDDITTEETDNYMVGNVVDVDNTTLYIVNP